MLNPGMILSNRYEIIELIGTGGMSEVYKAVSYTHLTLPTKLEV